MTALRDPTSAARLSDTIREAQAKAGGIATVIMMMTPPDPARFFLAFSLADGSWDGTLYDTRDDALRHQAGDRNQYGYIPIPPEPWTPRVCDSLLMYWRRVYEGGYRPDGSDRGLWVARTPNNVEVVYGNGR